MYETACTPYSKGRLNELNSDIVNNELAKWEPLYDYGTDSVFSITPPVVSDRDNDIYEESCQVAEEGPSVSPSSELVHNKYIKLWSSQTIT